MIVTLPCGTHANPGVVIHDPPTLIAMPVLAGLTSTVRLRPVGDVSSRYRYSTWVVAVSVFGPATPANVRGFVWSASDQIANARRWSFVGGFRKKVWNW